LAFTDLSTDPRVHRQIRFLAPHFDVLALGCGDPKVPGVDFLRIDNPLLSYRQRLIGAALRLARQNQRFHTQLPVVRSAVRQLGSICAKVILANDLETVPAAHHNGAGARVLLDAHEYAAGEFDDDLRFRFMYGAYRTWLCRTYIPTVDAMVTVSPGIADAYASHFGRRPDVLWSAPDFVDQQPLPTEPGRIRLVHHGIAVRRRGLEVMIEAMQCLDDRFELNLVLMASEPDYLGDLKKLASGDPRVVFHPPVPMRELPVFLNRFDVGIFSHQERSLQATHILPNKFFEFVQARLALVIGPSPDMANLLNQHDLGVIASDFSAASLARALASLDPETVNHHKNAAHRAASSLCAEAVMPRLVKTVASLLGEGA
jgi:glycosyltransferase involved in cell wall biosynthesis